MQILDAAEVAGVELLVLFGAARVTLSHQGAGAEFDPVAVSVGAAFVNLFRRGAVGRLRPRPQDEQRQAGQGLREPGLPTARAKFSGFTGFHFSTTDGHG